MTSAPHQDWLVRIAVRVETFLVRHKRVFVGVLLLLLAVEGARLIARQKMGDFSPVFRAVERLEDGQPLYVEEQRAAFVYSPFFALISYPLSVLPLAGAKALFYLLSCLATFLAVILTTRILWPQQQGIDRPVPTGFLFLMLSGSIYFWYNALGHGQSTPLMVALVIASYFLDLYNRPTLSGVCLALSLSIKPFPVLFILFYALRKRWWTVFWCVFFWAVVLALPVLVFGSAYDEILEDWVAVNHQQQTLYDITSRTHQSVSAFWHRLFRHVDPEPFDVNVADPATWAIGITVLALLVAAMWLNIQAGRAPADSALARGHAAFAAWMVCWAALPPTAWKHYYVTLLFPVGLLAKWVILSTSARQVASYTLQFLIAGVFLLHVTPEWAHKASFPFLMGFCTLGCVAFFSLYKREDAAPMG